MLFLAKDEYTFTFLKGSAGTSGSAAGPARPQAGDTALKGLVRNLEKILKDSSKETSDKLAKSIESILVKFAKVPTQVKGVAASAGLSRVDARRIAKEVASEIANQQIKQLVKAFPSQGPTTASDSKIIQSIEKSADRQAKTIVAGLNSILSRQGVQLENTKDLERAVAGAVKSAIPKETSVSIKEIGRLTTTIMSGMKDINKIAQQMMSMRKSGGGIDVKEIKEMMKSVKELNSKFKQASESTVKIGQSAKNVAGDIGDLKKNISEFNKALTSKVKGVAQRAEADPAKFAKTTAVAVAQALEKSLKRSPAHRGSDLEGEIKKLGNNVKSVGEVLNKFEKIQGNIVTAIQKGEISIDTKAIDNLSKDLGNLPKKLGGDINVKGWKELTTGLETFSKKVESAFDSLKDLKVKMAVDLDSKSLEKKVEKAVERGITNNVKTLTKEIDSTFNKIIGEMRKMYSALPKESPIRPKLEKAGKELKAAKESGDYPYIAKRVGGMQSAIKAPELNKTITDLKGAIVELTSELKGAGIDDIVSALKDIEGDIRGTKLDEKLKRSEKAIDDLTSAADKKAKEISRQPSASLDPSKAMDKIKFLQKTSRSFPQEFIQPGKSFELKGTDIGFGADVRKSVKEKADSLAMSLKDLEKDLITGLQAGPGFAKYGWKLLDKELKNIGQQWTLQIANIPGIESLLKGLDKNYVKIADPKILLKTYEEKRKQQIVSETKNASEQADRVGKWLNKRTEEDIDVLASAGTVGPTSKGVLKGIKTKYSKASEVGEDMRKELVTLLGGSLEEVFRETFAADKVKKELTSGIDGKPFVRRVALPAAQISKTGTAIFKTRYGTERALPKFATYKTGFEELYEQMDKQKAMVGEEYAKYNNDILKIGMNPKAVGMKGERGTLQLAKVTSKEMLSKMAKAGPNQLEYVLNQYKEAATMVGAKRQQAGIGSVSNYEKKIATGIESFKSKQSDLPAVFDDFVKYMEDLGISSYDVVKSLESIKFENVYDIYRKVLKGKVLKGKGKKGGDLFQGPTPGLAQYPDSSQNMRKFDQAIAQVEQMMPIIEKSKVRRGKHQEEVTTTLFQTSPLYKGAEKELAMDAGKQKDKILAINMNLRDMLKEYETLSATGASMTEQTAKRLERYKTIPRGVKTISTLGPPEEQASRYKEYRSGKFADKAKSLAPLESTAIKLYTEKLLDQAPFGEFSRLGKQIGYVNSAMSSLSADAKKVFDVAGITTEEPKLRTTKEREIISSGRYGKTGYGFNVIAELKHSADTFEDQIVVSGNLAKALTQAVSTLVKPGPKGRIGTVGGPHVTGMKEGQILRDVTPKAIGEVSKQFMEIMGVPQEYKKEADKALIETIKKEIISVRGKDVEIQKAQLAEVFMNYFGRKFTTRYGSKGVSVTPEGEAGLGVAKIPKSMGMLASEILGKIEEEGKAPKFGKAKDVSGMQKDLVESGNKFMISMFSDATDQVAKGLGVEEEIDKQAEVYKKFTALIKRVYGEELPKDVEGIEQLRKLYQAKVGGKLYEEKPIDIRISARGAIKRGLQPEFIESMLGNVIGQGAGETTIQDRPKKAVYEEILGTKRKAGRLSEYSKALGFESAGVPKEQIEKELTKTFMAAGKDKETAELMAKRAAAFESAANYYTSVQNEYGKAVKSIVGPKFVQIIEEPHENEKWSTKGIMEGKKGAKINLAAYSAYAGVFGEKSSMMDQIKGSSTADTKKQFEYIKALEAMAQRGPGKEMSDALMKGIRKVPLKELQAFEPRTGTFSKDDMERSLKGTVLDLEKFGTEFAVDLPTGKGAGGEIQRKPFYIPGPLARQTYPEELLAGEYGMDDVSRYLQMVINKAKEAEAAISGEGPQTKDISTKIKTQVKADVATAKGGDLPVKTKIFDKFWEGLKDVKVDPKWAADTKLPENLTERQYIKAFHDKFQERYAQDPGKTYDEALQLTIGRMSDILIGAGGTTRQNLQDIKPRLAKEVEAGTTGDLAKKLGIDTSDDKVIDEQLKQLREAKVNYMNSLAKSMLGKSGAIQSTFFERKAPAIIGKAVTAVTDRTTELENFSTVLRDIAGKAGFEKYVGAFTEIADAVDDIGKEHKGIIDKYKKQGVPVLKQEELGIPEAMARKIPVKFEKKYEMQDGMPIRTGKTKEAATVDSNLYKMLEYKNKLEDSVKAIGSSLDTSDIQDFIKEELVPHVETMRFPFTGVSSLQPYKAKMLPEEQYPKGKFTYAVPGIPEMRMATEGGKTGFVEVVKKLEGIRDTFVAKREELHTTSEAAGMQADPARVADLTDKITMLDKAISDVLPKYSAIQQKLDFDGDEIEAHSGVLAEARQDIKKHFDVLNKSTNSIETAWRQVRGFEETAPGSTSSRFPFADLLTYFESKWAPEKGYEFLKKPELTEQLDFLKPEKRLDILSLITKKPAQQLLKETAEEQIPGSAKYDKVASAIDSSVNEGAATSKELLAAVRALGSDFYKLIDSGVKNNLYQQKYTDAIIGQLYKLHTGPETEAVYRVQRVAESRMGFGGGMVSPETGYRTDVSSSFRKRWPTELKMLGKESPESEISTFMNELSRFAQQKGMDVKLAGEKPVGGEITSKLGQGTKGVNELLEKIGLAGDQADDDYKQLKEFAKTSEEVIRKRLGALPTDVIKKEVSSVRAARGMPEIATGTRKDAVDEAVKLMGLEGFLRELSQQIEEDAVEALVARLKSLPKEKREKEMFGKTHMPIEEFAKGAIKTSEKYGMMSPTGISTGRIMQQRAPLYGLRSAMASKEVVAGAYRETAPEVKIPAGLSKYAAESYRQSQEVALSIARSLKESTQQEPGGAYSDLVLSTIDNLYKEQESRESKLNQLKKEGYDISTKRELSDIPKRMFEEGMPDIPSFIKDLVNPSNDAAGSLKSLKKEIDEISLLAGMPPLTSETKRQMKTDMPEFGAFARAKYPEVAGETEEGKTEREVKISEFTDLLIQKAQAVAQMDRAIASLISAKGFETKLLPPKEDIKRILEGGIIKSTITAPKGRITGEHTSPTRQIREAKERAMVEKFASKEDWEKPKIAGDAGGPTGGYGGAGGLGGKYSDEVVRVHIQSVQDGIGLSFTPAGAAQGTIAKSYLTELRELQKRASGIGETTGSYADVYRASGLAGGGIYQGTGPKEQQQIQAIKEQMTKGGREVPPHVESASFEGTIIHKKEQDRLMKELESKTGGKEKYDTERFVKYTSTVGKDVTGHVDLIKQRLDEDTQKYVDEKIIDIKTVSDHMIKRFKDLGVEKFSDLPALKEKGGLTKYDVHKLEEVASQINLYIAAVAQANGVAADSLKGEAWFYDRDDIDNMAKVSFDFDPAMLKKDMVSVAKARKSVIQEFGRGKFAKAASIEDLMKAEAKRKSGYEPLSGEDWERFEDISKKHKAALSKMPRQEDVRPAGLTKEKHRATQSEQRARFEGYTIPEAPVMGEGVYDQLENLKRIHRSAKEYQLRSKGINIEKVGDGLNENLASIVDDVKVMGPQGKKFGDAIEDLKYAGLIGGGEITKAWKYYRIALGDFFIKQAEQAKQLEGDLSQQGEFGAAREAYGQAEKTINQMKERMSRTFGKPSDIYTEMRKFIDPDLIKSVGLYETPEQLLTKSAGPLGMDEKLDTVFKKTIVGDVLEGGKLISPIEKVREAIKDMSDLDKEMVNTLTDADKFKRAGAEIQEAWDFNRLTERVTKLRATLENFLRFRLQEDADVVGRKNLEDTLKLLKNLENQYSSFGRVQREGPAGWGETGVAKVPRFLEPKQQFAMHQRNIQKVREYFKKTEETGGPKPDERYTYMFKVIGEAGDTIKNVAYDFRKYGDALNFAGEKVGTFSEAQRDLSQFMQEGGRTFKSAIMRAVRWGAASRIVYGGWQKLGQSIGLLADIETGMANLRMVMSPLETDFGKLGKSAIGFAKQYGVPMTDVLKSMKIFAQQGLPQGEVISRTETATLASNVTTLSAADATEALTAAMKVFRQEGEGAMKFMDAWSEVEAKHAITAGDMANALKKAASAGKNAGFTFDELNGIVAAVGSVTRQTGKEVGTSMRFIFRRLASEEGPKALGKIGIPVLTGSGELRKGFDVLNDLSMSWKDLTSAQKMNIAQAVGGTRQYNSLLVLMDNWNEALSAIKDSTNSKGSAERRNLEIMKTFTKQMEQMKQAATEVYMSFGKITFPVAKVGLKGLKFLLEAFTEVPGVIKGAMVAVSGFFVYMSKGADIIDYFFDRWRGGKSVIGEVMKGIGKEWSMGMSELFGMDALEENLKTVGKGKKIKIPTGIMEVSPEGVAQQQTKEGFTTQGRRLRDFHSVLGKTAFLIKQAGMTYNQFVGDMAKDSAGLLRDVGGPFDYIGKKLVDLSIWLKGGTKIFEAGALKDVFMKGGPVGLLKAIPTIMAGVASVTSKAAGETSKVVAKAADFAGDKFGKAGKSFVENFASDNTSMVKALAPLVATGFAVYPALKGLSEYYMKTTQSAQEYEKSAYGVRRANESQLKGIRELMGTYGGLQSSLADTIKVSSPDVKKRRQELGTYESPLLTMSSIVKKSRDLSNSLADSNINLVGGYDKFGNAILNITGDLKDYLKTLENIKVRESAKIEIDVAAKFVTDLTEIEGPEKWKYALKNLLKEAPAFGEVLAKSIKVSPAKALDVVTNRLNDMLALKKKFPMSTAFDKDIKKYQDNLKTVRSGFTTTYNDFRRVLSDVQTKGLNKNEVAKLLGAEELRKGYQLMIDVEPRFNLKETKGKIEWQDVLGAEVMKRTFPSFASTFDATKVLTKARLETAGAVQRQGKAMSGDVAFFMDSAADKYGIAGSQAVVSLKETTDGVFNWFVTYFNSKTLQVEEKPFTKDLQNMVESIFPKSKIEEELSDRISSLNEFTAGASAGLRGISAKDFKKDFGLGERFFSDIPTTTILQGSKGYVPGAGGKTPTFGQSPFQKDWKDTTQEFFFKPMREYRLKAEQLEKLKLEGLQGGEVTLAKGLFEELTKLQNILKNNQVVLQYRAVFVDLTKTLEAGTRALKENLAVEKSRLQLRKGVAGYQKGISEGLDAIDLGVQRFSDMNVKQRALRGGPEYGRAATRFRELETKRTAGEEQVYGIDRALVALENIRQTSQGFGAALSSEDMKKYVDIIAKTDDTGAQSIAIETSKVVDNTASTVERLDKILENMGDPDAILKSLENVGDLSPGRIVNKMERVARIRDANIDSGNKDLVQSSNKSLDLLTNSLVEQVGIKKSMSMVESSYSLLKDRKFKPEEFAQRAFGGLDLKQFTSSMEEQLPTQRSLFKRIFGIGRDVSGFKDEIKPLVKLQEEGNKDQWLSSKDMAKMSAATAVWTGLNKNQSRDLISGLESQRQYLKPGTEERKDLEARIEKEKKGSLKEGKIGEELLGTAEGMTALTTATVLFGRELGMTEGGIKKLTAAVAGLYGASKVIGTKPEGKQAGGLITGPGGPRDDKININASAGEYIIKAGSTKKLGKDALDHINKYGTLPGMQAGGKIGPKRMLTSKGEPVGSGLLTDKEILYGKDWKDKVKSSMLMGIPGISGLYPLIKGHGKLPKDKILKEMLLAGMSGPLRPWLPFQSGGLVESSPVEIPKPEEAFTKLLEKFGVEPTAEKFEEYKKAAKKLRDKTSKSRIPKEFWLKGLPDIAKYKSGGVTNSKEYLYGKDFGDKIKSSLLLSLPGMGLLYPAIKGGKDLSMGQIIKEILLSSLTGPLRPWLPFQSGGAVDSILNWSGVLGGEGSIKDLAGGLRKTFGGKDNVPIRASNGEYIINSDKAKKLGYNRLDYMNEYGELPGFAEGGIVGTAPTGAPASGGKVNVNISDDSLVKLRNLLLPYLAATATGYVAQRTEDDTRLATLNKQAEKEANLFVDIVKKYPDAAQKMIDARKRLVQQSEKISTVPTMEKSLVMDTEKERTKIVGDLSKIREEIIREHEKEVEELSNIASKLAKLEIAEKFKMELEQMEKAMQDIDIASSVRQAIDLSQREYTSGSIFDVGLFNNRFASKQWSGDIADILSDRMNEVTDELKRKSGGLLSGVYSAQKVDYGVRRVQDMTPEQQLAYSGKTVTSPDTSSRFFFAQGNASDMLKNLESMQQKRDVQQSKLIENVTRREELKGRKGDLSETESAELKKLDGIIESLGDSLTDLTDKIGDAKDTLKESLEEAADIIRRRTTAFDALKGLQDFNVKRFTNTTAVLNKGTAGFGGGYELPTGKREMPLQQRIFTDATDAFNQKANEYAYKMNTLIPSMSQNISELVSMRAEVPAGDTERYDELTKQLEKLKERFTEVSNSARAMGEALFVANKFAEVMYKFKDSIQDIQIAESVEDLKGFKGFRESMDKVFGGSHPLAPVQVSPEEQRRGAMVGADLRDLRSNQFDKMRAEALHQIQYGGLQGKQYQQAVQRYADIPEIQARAEDAYKQKQEVGQLQRQAAPFENLLQMLQRLSVSENITPERKQEVEAIRDALAGSIDGFGTIMTQEQKKADLEQNKALFSPDEYKRAMSQIESGSSDQYKGLSAVSLKRLYQDFGGEFKDLQKGVPAGDLADAMPKGFNDITTRQEIQIDLLKQIAKEGFGFTPTDIGEKTKIPELPLDNLLKNIGGILSGRNKFGNWISGRAIGGRVFGEGGPREDKVPAMLSPGEYVIRAASAQRLGFGTLEHMNKKGEIPGFAEGTGGQRRFIIGDEKGRSYPGLTPREEALIKKQEEQEKVAPTLGENVLKKAVREKTKIGGTLEKHRKDLEEALKYAEGGPQMYKILPHTGVSFPKDEEELLKEEAKKPGLLQRVLDKVIRRPEDLPLGTGLLRGAKEQILEEKRRREETLKLAEGTDVEKMSEYLKSIKADDFSRIQNEALIKNLNDVSKYGAITQGEESDFEEEGPIVKKPIDKIMHAGYEVTKASLFAPIVEKYVLEGVVKKYGSKVFNKYAGNLVSKMLPKIKGISGKHPKITESLHEIFGHSLFDTSSMGLSKLNAGVGQTSKLLSEITPSAGNLMKVVGAGFLSPSGADAQRTSEYEKRFRINAESGKVFTPFGSFYESQRDPHSTMGTSMDEIINEMGGMRKSSIKEIMDNMDKSITLELMNIMGGLKSKFATGGIVDDEEIKYKKAMLGLKGVSKETATTAGFGNFIEELYTDKKEEDKNKMVETAKAFKEVAATYTPIKEKFTGGLKDRPAQKATTPEGAAEWKKAHRAKQEKIKEMSAEHIRYFDDYGEMSKDAFEQAYIGPKIEKPFVIDEKAWKPDEKSKAWINELVEARRRGIPDEEDSPFRPPKLTKTESEIKSTAVRPMTFSTAETMSRIQDTFAGATDRGAAKEMMKAYSTKAEQDKYFKVSPSNLPGGKLSTKVQGIIAADEYKKAKERASAAAADKFTPVMGTTTRVSPDQAAAYRGYDISKHTRAGDDPQAAGESPKRTPDDFYRLREMQNQIAFLEKNIGRVYAEVQPGEQEKVDKYIKSQTERINELVSSMQSGKFIGSKEDVEKYNTLTKDFGASSGLIYNRLSIRETVDKYKGFEGLVGLPGAQGVIDLINEGKTEKAKELYDKTKSDLKALRETYKKKGQKDIFDLVSAGLNRENISKELQLLKVRSESDRIKTLGQMSGESGDNSLALLKKLFPDYTEDAIKRKIASMSPKELEAYLKDVKTKQTTVTGENKHHGGEIRKTGHVFMQKGEMVYPKGFAEGGPVYGELAKETANSALNGSMKIEIDTTALDDAIGRLEALEFKVDTRDVNLVVDGDAAAAKIQAAVENINIDISSTGAVGAEELKKISDQLEDRINGLNINVEDIQNELKIINAPGETIDVNSLITDKVNQYTLDIDRKIGEVKSDISHLESRITQKQNMINFTTIELERKIMHLQNLTGRGNG